MGCESTGNESEAQRIHEAERDREREREGEGEPASHIVWRSPSGVDPWTGGRYHGRKGNIASSLSILVTHRLLWLNLMRSLLRIPVSVWSL